MIYRDTQKIFTFVPMYRTELIKDLSDITGNDFDEVVQYLNFSHLFEAFKDGKRYLLKVPDGKGRLELEILKREFEISRRLEHDRILTPIRFAEDSPKGPAIVMDYVYGRTLTEFLKENPSLLERKRVWDQLLDVMDHLHSKGIVYNDLKPDNIIVQYAGNNIKLIDFDRADSPTYKLTRLGGTPGYSAPEVLKGERNARLAPATDVYSLGTILKELFPYRFKWVVRKCRRKDMSRRFKNIKDLRLAFGTVLSLRFIYLLVAVVFAVVMAFSLIQGKEGKVEESVVTEQTCSEPRKVEKKKPQFSDMRFRVSKADCNAMAVENGQRGISLSFRLKVSPPSDTLVRVVVSLFAANKIALPKVDSAYSFMSQAAICSEVSLDRRRHDMSLFIPFKALPHMPDIPHDGWLGFKETVGLISYRLYFQVNLLDASGNPFYQSDLQSVDFGRLPDYYLIYR